MLSQDKSLAKTNPEGILLDKERINTVSGEREESMAGKERLMVIRQTVQTEKKVTVSDLSRICRVTEETIRRDLDKLETEGILTRIHGGAIWNEGAQKEVSQSKLCFTRERIWL